MRRSTGEVCAIGEAKRRDVINLEEFVTYVHDHLQEKNLRDPATVDILNAFHPQSSLEGKVCRYTPFRTILQPCCDPNGCFVLHVFPVVASQSSERCFAVFLLRYAVF